MNLRLNQDILDLFCNKLWWVESSMVMRVLSAESTATTNLAAALRYLCKKRLLELHVVNCSDSLTHEPIVTSQSDSSTDDNSRNLKTDWQTLTTQIRSVWQPTQFYCASRITAGLFGVKYSQPSSVLEWYAHRRMANAFLHYVGSSDTNRHCWHAVELTAVQPNVLLASFQSTLICVPFEVNQRLFDRILGRIKRTGFKYEVW